MEFFEKLEKVRSTLNISKGYFCHELGITSRTYGNWKEKTPKKAALYLERAMLLLDSVQVVLTGIREHRKSVLNRIIPLYLYEKIKGGLQETDISNFQHIYEKSSNHIARMQALIFIGKIGSRKGYLRAQSCLLGLKADWLKNKDYENQEKELIAIELGFNIGLTLLKYPDAYPEVIDNIKQTTFFSYWKEYAWNYYGDATQILKGIEEMILACDEGYNIFGIINLYTFAENIHELLIQADTKLNYIKLFTTQLIDIRENNEFRNKTKQKLFSLINDIEHILKIQTLQKEKTHGDSQRKVY